MRTRIRVLRIFYAVGFSMLSASGALAQQTAEKEPRPVIQVSGDATVTVKPDQAQIDIGVVTQAKTAEAAANQNRQQLDSVLRELHQALGAGADIQTTSYSLQPNYREFKPGGEPAIVGYTATNVVQVKTKMLDEVGKVIDVATQSGANTIRRLEFTLQDMQTVRSQALRKAAIQAKAEAETLAEALGLKIVRVLSVSESTPIAIPIRAMAMAAQAAAPTPIEPGTIDVHATVSLTVEISPR